MTVNVWGERIWEVGDQVFVLGQIDRNHVAGPVTITRVYSGGCTVEGLPPPNTDFVYNHQLVPVAEMPLLHAVSAPL